MNFTESPFLTQESNGTIRLTGSRLTLDTLATHIKKGRTAEEIHDSFPSVSIQQISDVMAWYGNHQAATEEYLRVGAAEADKLRQEIESDPRNQIFRAKLRQRKEQFTARRQLTPKA